MVDNQHRKIKGYRDLSEEEIVLMKLKSLDNSLVLLQADCEGILDADPRWLNIGKAHLQQGLMAYKRAVAKPDLF